MLSMLKTSSTKWPMPALRTAAASIFGSPLERMASRNPICFRSSKAGFTSGNAAKCKYDSMSRARLSPVKLSSRLLVEYTSASSVRFQKSRYWPMRLRNQLYSSCFLRQICDSSLPRPGKSSSQSDVTEKTSNNVPYASKTRAFIRSPCDCRWKLYFFWLTSSTNPVEQVGGLEPQTRRLQRQWMCVVNGLAMAGLVPVCGGGGRRKQKL